MVNQQALKHHWEEVCDQLQEKWENLESTDLPSFPGNLDQLIGRIQQKTGESREAIEAYLSELTEEGSAAAQEMRQRLEAGAARAADSARRGCPSHASGLLRGRRGDPSATRSVDGRGLRPRTRGRHRHCLVAARQSSHAIRQHLRPRSVLRRSARQATARIARFLGRIHVVARVPGQ